VEEEKFDRGECIRDARHASDQRVDVDSDRWRRYPSTCTTQSSATHNHPSAAIDGQQKDRWHYARFLRTRDATKHHCLLIFILFITFDGFSYTQFIKKAENKGVNAES